MLENIYNLFVFIALFLDSIIYSLISWVYQIILVLCQVDILNNSYEITQLMNRLYIVIGVIVLFLLAYSLLKSMVNPDDALKNKKGPVAIIKDVIISIVLIALVPSIFSFAQGFQQSLLMENTIGKIILGNNAIGGESSENTIENGGIEIASNILQAFLHPTNDQCTYIKSEARFDCSQVPIATENTIGWIPVVGFFFSVDGGYNNYDAIWESIKDTGNFLSITSFAYSISHESVLSYYFIISTAVGIFVLLVLLSYCIDIAIRAVKLAVFQLIAPLPILARIMPNEQGGKVFSNWLKATLSTYLEVFIRLAILFFAVLLIKIVVQNLPSLLIVDDFLGGEASFTVYLFAQLFVIVGIILFIKQAPQIIKDITGLDSGKYGFFTGMKQGMSALGAMGALGTGAVRGFTTGFDSNHKVRSIFGGLKNGLSSGSRSFASALGKEYKHAGDLRRNTHDSVEEVINRQRQKQADKAAQKQELEDYRSTVARGANEPKFLYKARTSAAHALKTKGEGIAEWAGVTGHDAVTDNRTSQAIRELTQLIDRMQDSWKKDPGYQKNKEEYNQAEGTLKAITSAILRDKSVNGAQILADLESTDVRIRSAAEAQANIIAQRDIGISYIDAKTDAAHKKNILKGTELSLQQSAGKSSQITSAINEIQGVMNKFRDIDLTNFNKLEGTAFALSSDEKIAVSSYGQLSSEAEYNKFLSDLRAGSQNALNYLEALDKLANNARRGETDIARRKIERSDGQQKKQQ